MSIMMLIFVREITFCITVQRIGTDTVNTKVVGTFVKSASIFRSVQKEGLDDKKVLELLEYIFNIMAVCDAYMPKDSEWSKEFKMLYQNVVNVVNSLNYRKSLTFTERHCENDVSSVFLFTINRN